MTYIQPAMFVKYVAPFPELFKGHVVVWRYGFVLITRDEVKPSSKKTGHNHMQQQGIWVTDLAIFTKKNAILSGKLFACRCKT